MPVRTYNDRCLGFPQDLRYNGIDLDNEEEFEKLARSMPFVDLNAAMHNRLVKRDPICGIGDLPKELDPLEGHCLRPRSRSTHNMVTSPIRDPILLEGDFGGEYNCLYTTRELKCKDRDDRNIITLEGNLGVELDPVRPHGGRPRSSIKTEAVRNPITGTGEFRKEWDPIWKYEGKHYFKRPEQVKRDPVTHSVPPENMGEVEPKFHIKHFNNDNQKSTDIISHDCSNRDLRDSENITNTRIRHFSQQYDRNPITHESKLGISTDAPWRAGTKHFPDKNQHDNPITHHGFSDDIDERLAKEQRARLEEEYRVSRDPISGTGFKEKESMQLWHCPTDYPFRSFLKPKLVPKENSNKQQPAKAVKNKT